MRLTKQLAENVAYAMTASKREAVKELKNKLGEQVHAWYVKNMMHPDLVSAQKNLEVNKFLNSHDWVRFYGNGFNGEHIYFPKGLEIIGPTTVQTPEEHTKAWRKLCDQAKGDEKAEKELRRLIENTLYNLRTYAKVSEKFPEALAFLPAAEAKSLPSIPIDEIRKQLAND